MKRELATTLILILLLFLRVSLPIAKLAAEGFGSQTQVPLWLSAYEKWNYLGFLLGGFPLLVIVIVLNRNRLDRMNMDRYFVLMFLSVGLIVIAECFVLHWTLGVLAASAALVLLYLLLRRQLTFAEARPEVRGACLLVVAIFVVILLLIGKFLNFPRIGHTLLDLFSDNIPFSIYEEALFRGILWDFLRNRNWGDRNILIGQALVFWLVHIDQAVSYPVNFGVLLPLFSFLVGYLVLRLKTISPTSVIHILYNALYSFVLTSFPGL